MKKKLVVGDLVVGMYLHELAASWIKNPFWRNSFLITTNKEIDALKASGIAEVWIDTDKGLGVAPPPPDDTMPLPLPDAVPELKTSRISDRAPASMADELLRASAICAEARQAVTSMFLEARMGNTVDTAAAGQLVQNISDSVARNGSALISLARLKTADDYTYMHSVAVCAMMIALSRQLGLDDNAVRDAGEAGLLHDMGKALIPLHVLNKPGKLTDEEFAIVRRHPVQGHALLSKASGVSAMTLDVCLHHHEKMDGSGYPKRLDASAISLFAKMGAVCDVYDAITSNRPYKEGWDPAESMRRMGQWAEDGHFDPVVFQAFAKSLGIYPVGSLVRLSSGMIGVVTAQGAKSLTQPLVRVFYATQTGERVTPHVVDLAVPGGSDKIVLREDPAKWHFSDLDDMWQQA